MTTTTSITTAPKLRWLISSENPRHIVDEEGFTIADASGAREAMRIVHDHNNALTVSEIYQESICTCGHSREQHKTRYYLFCDVSICGCLDFETKEGEK